MRSRTIFFALGIVLAIFASRWLGPSRSPAPAGPAVEAPAPGAPLPTPATASPEALVIPAVVVHDVDGRVAWRGNVDLAPTLARIEAGERDAHPNDGGIFGNREGLLPAREPGYYREYVVRTPGITHTGPQRVIVGRGGELWYTSDHYESFRRIR